MSNSKIYGLVGASLAHSFSKDYFSHKFDNEGISADYLNFELNNISELESVLSKPNLSGLNVTIPYKEQVIPFLDNLSIEAKEVGAVNTIQFIDGKTMGHNTDVFGFSQMIKPFFQSHHERVIILGTGGASKAVAHVLEKLGCDIIYISRNKTAHNVFGYEDVNEQMLKSCLLVVNTTPVGMFPEILDCPIIPYKHLTPKHLVVDLIYNPAKTKFLQQAEVRGAVTLNGQSMLEQQAERSWNIWNE